MRASRLPISGFLLTLLGCGGGGGGGGGGSAPPPTPQTWLVMIYIAADNDLEESVPFDLNLMEAAPNSPYIKTVVQVDTMGLAVNGSATAKRLLIQNDADPDVVTSPTLVDLGEINSVDPAAILDFVAWAWAAYPSQRKALILWDHGGQWSGWGEDATSGAGALGYLDLKNMFANMQLATGIAHFDIVGFDACLMAGLEVDYMLSPYVYFRVASCEVEMGGWNFEGALTALAANPGMGPMLFAEAICDTFIALKNSQGSTNQTQSVAELWTAQSLVTAVDAFAASLRANLVAELGPCIAPARRLSAEYGKQQQNQPAFYIDLRHFAERVFTTTAVPALAAAASGVMTAVDVSVTHRAQGAQAPYHRGVSIYFPNCSCDPSQIDYPDVDLSQATQWDEFIAEYQAALVTDTTPPGVTITAASASNVSSASPVTVDFTLTGGDIVDVSAMISFPLSTTSWVIFGEIDFGTLDAGNYSFTWDAEAFAIEDGAAASYLPAWSIAPNTSLYLAIMLHEPVSGPAQNLIVILNLDWATETGSILGFLEVTASGTLGSRQVVEGDLLTVQFPVWDTTTQTLTYQLGAATLTVPPGGASSLGLFTAQVPDGSIDVDIFAEDYAENIGVDTVTLTVP